MKERGKAIEETYNSNYTDYYSASDLSCKKHPSSSSVGICAYCLKDRLIKLVCSDCGEQRLSSCSCSEISSNRNSCTVEIGSVGRVSFLIENERSSVSNSGSRAKLGYEKAEEVVLLKRCSSSCSEIKRNGLWKIGRWFKKNREKNCERRSVCGLDEKSDLYMFDEMRVSRSRSLCSFRGGGLFGSEDGGEHLVVSGARSSISGARTSSVNGGLLFESGRRSGFSEAEPRKSGFDSGLDYHENGFNSTNRRVFSLKESDFNGVDDNGFIDLKLDFASELSAAKFDGGGFGGMRAADLAVNEGSGVAAARLIGAGGGSCRITVSDTEKKGRKSLKAWRWIFKHPPNWSSGVARKKDEEFTFKTQS